MVQGIVLAKVKLLSYLVPCKTALKINVKKIISRYPLRESTSFCMSTSFEEYIKMQKKHYFVRFLDFRREITEKGLKWTKKVEYNFKNVLTSFRVRAPKSWSKYTTNSVNISSEQFEHISTQKISKKMERWKFWYDQIVV